MSEPTTNRRGRRNPELARELGMPEGGGPRIRPQVRTDDTPDDYAEIGPEEVAEDEMVRGELMAPGEQEMTDELLMAGDVVLAKAVHTIKFDDDDSWFTYGVSSRIREDESEEEAFLRISSVVNQRVLDMAILAEEQLLGIKDHRHELDQHRREERFQARQRPAGGRIQRRGDA